MMDPFDKWIIVDLDGTLADASHRFHLAQARDWEAHAAGIMNDDVCEDVAEVMHRMSDAGFNVLLVTARGEEQREATQRWLECMDLACFVDQLLMRPKEQRTTPEHTLKIDLIYDFFASMNDATSKTVFVLEDKDKCVEAFRNAGFKCWQVQAGSH